MSNLESQIPIGRGTPPSALTPDAAPYQGMNMGLSAPEAARVALREEVMQLSALRGALRAGSAPDLTALEKIDDALARAVTAALVVSPPGSPGYLEICKAAKESHDEARLGTAEAFLRQCALRIGLAQGRDLDEHTVHEERERIATYREAHSDLFSQYSNLNSRVDEIIAGEERRGIRMRLDADKIAISISISLRRFIPQSKTLLDALSKKTAHEIELISQAFRSRYGEDLESFVRTAYARPGLKLLMPVQPILERAIDLLNGRRVAHGKLETSYAAAFLKQIGGKLNPRGVALAKLREAGGFQAEAFLLRQAFDGPTKKAHRVFGVFEAAGKDKLAEVEAAFEKAFPGRALKTELQNMEPGYSKDRALAFYDGDMTRYRAACIGCALERAGKTQLIAMLEKEDRATRRELIHTFEKLYDVDFWTATESRMRKSDVFLLRALYEHEQVPKAEMIWHCVDGHGTHEHGIRRILSGLTHAEIEQLRSEYEALSKGRTWSGRAEKLDDRLKSETSGDAWHDIQRLLKGVPVDAHAMHEILLDGHAHERSGSWIQRVDLFTREGAVMDADVKRADTVYNEQILGKLPTADALRRFETLVRFCNRDMVGFRMSKNDWSDFVANTVSAVSAIASVWPIAKLTGGIELPYLHAAVVALGAGITQGGIQFFLKVKLKGDGFGREEKLRDIALSALRAGSFYLSKFLPISVLRRPIDFGAKLGLKTIVRLGEAGDAQRIPAHALTLRDLPRALDEDSSFAPPDKPETPLSDHADGELKSCSLAEHDSHFERTLQRLLSA